MSIVMNFTLGVDRGLLKRHVTVVMSAVGVTSLEGKADSFGFGLHWSYFGNDA
jgi:hypothetical protein